MISAKSNPPLLIFLSTGFIIGALLACCELTSIHSHLLSVWFSIYGIMFLLSISYTKNFRGTFLITFIPSFLASIPYLWIIDANYNVPFSSLLLATINAYALNTFYLNYQCNHFKLSYTTLFQVVWDSFVQLFIAVLFTLLCFSILILAGSLFALVKFSIFNTLLSKHWFQLWSSAFFISAGLSVCTQQTIGTIRSILLLICQYLLVPLSIIGLIFIGLLVITFINNPQFFNHQILFLSIAFLCIIFINGIYQDGHAKNPYPPALSILCQLFWVITPVFTLLALFGIIFEGPDSIKESGLDYNNFPYLLNIIILFIYNISYTLITLIRKKPWLKLIEKTNIILAFILITLTILTINPWFLKILHSPKHQAHIVTPDNQNAQFNNAGFFWSKSLNSALVIGFDQAPIYFCRPINTSNAGGIINQKQCEWIDDNNLIQRTVNFSVLSGHEKKSVWLSFKSIASDTRPAIISLDYTAKKPKNICRLIYQNHIVIGTSSGDNSCIFITHGKIVSETKLLQFLYQE